MAAPNDIFSLLRANAWFKQYNDPELQLLAQFLKVRTFNDKDPIYDEGRPGRACYIIAAGEVSVFKEVPGAKREHLTNFGAGGIFGLVALIDGKGYSETCVAAGPAMLLELSRPDFDRLFQAQSSLAYKFLFKVNRVLTRQLRVANERLAAIHGKAAAAKAAGKPAAEKAATGGLSSQQRELLNLIAEAEGSVSKDIDLDEVDYVIFEGQQR